MIRYGGVDHIEPDERPGWSRVRMHFDAEEVACHQLLAFGTRVEVIEPERVAEQIVSAARQLVDRAEVIPRMRGIRVAERFHRPDSSPSPRLGMTACWVLGAGYWVTNLPSLRLSEHSALSTQHPITRNAALRSG